MMARRGLAFWIATGGYSGLAPKAPGTAGSLAAAVIGAGLLWVSPALLAPAALAATIAGFWAVPFVAAPDEDPGFVVIDEWAGQFLAMAALGHFSGMGVAASFVLFRLFDIAKPGPIGWADRQSGAFGIMTDDVLAGFAAALILLGVRAFGWLP
jgi:phosphatidylglycerophosphatase A